MDYLNYTAAEQRSFSPVCKQESDSKRKNTDNYYWYERTFMFESSQFSAPFQEED